MGLKNTNSRIAFSLNRHGHGIKQVQRGQVMIPRPRKNAMKKMIMFRAI